MDNLYPPRTWEELFSLPGLSRDPVPRERMVNGKIVFDYEMDAKTGLRPCGIAQCHTPHRHGYVITMEGGNLVSYVGRDCGKSQFGAEWARMRNAYKALKESRTKEQALLEMRASLQATLDAWPSMDSEAITWARAVLAAYDGMPQSIRSTLTSRAVDGDTAVPPDSREETNSERQQRAFRENWSGKDLPPPKRIAISRGPLSGLSALKPTARVDYLIDKAIPALKKAAIELAASDTASPDDLGKMQKRLTDMIKHVDTSLGQLRRFIEPSNLELLRFLLPLKREGVASLLLDIGPPIRFAIDYRT